MKHILIFGVAILTLISCGGGKEKQVSGLSQKEKERTKLDSVLLEEASNLFGTLPLVAENPENPITDEKVKLGKALYFDTRLSKDNTISCNSCHNLNTYGVDNLKFSVGNDKNFGGRNSQTVLNAALHFAQFWDGRAKDVEEQAGGPILNKVEMAIPNKDFLINRLLKVKEYQDLFAKVYPEDEKPITYLNIQKAIGAFERKLITPSRFDDFLKGNKTALTDQEKDGLNVFINTGCITCHSGNVIGGKMFQKFGVYGNYWDYTKSKKIDNGRFEITKNEADKYVFKVPSLRNIEKTAPYFHDGSISNLKDAVTIMAQIQLNKKLSDKELNDVVAFLSTLTGAIPPDLK
jgi:cytochrome c peroxidase